jgi:molybdenum cofactor cytidylyltransferase
MGTLPTAGLVLAAGRGTRFGGNKLAAALDGRVLLQHVLDLVAAVGLAPVVVVLGADADHLEGSIHWRDEMRVVNQDAERGLSTSVRLGLATLTDLSDPADRALVLLGDQPRLTVEQVEPLLETPPDPLHPIVVPRYADGQPGTPVLLDRAAWSLAERLEGDRGMAQLFEARPELVRYVDVTGTNPDIDTLDDLAALA